MVLGAGLDVVDAVAVSAFDRLAKSWAVDNNNDVKDGMGSVDDAVANDDAVAVVVVVAAGVIPAVDSSNNWPSITSCRGLSDDDDMAREARLWARGQIQV